MESLQDEAMPTPEYEKVIVNGNYFCPDTRCLLAALKICGIPCALQLDGGS